MPEVSVIMPMRNAGPFVRQAVESVLAQLHASLELIVIDDGSSDNSRSIVQGIRDHRLRLLDSEGGGVCRAMNLGLAQARGSILMRCDADDLYAPDRIARQVGWLHGHPEYGAVCGQFAMIEADGRPVADALGGMHSEDITDELLWGTARTSLCTFAIRAAPLRRIGGFRSYFTIAEDMDLQFRLAEVCRIWFEPCNTYLYRLHETSTMHTQYQATVTFHAALASQLAQQRRAGGPDDLERGVLPPPPATVTGPRNGAAEHIQSMLMGQSWREFDFGSRRRALWLGLRACLRKPANLRLWKNLAALCLKRRSRATLPDPVESPSR